MQLSLTEAFALLSFAASGALAVTPRPRGVGPEFAKFYQSESFFTCISNPSITVSKAQVNDDYCDCPDGSDEPGTSACSYLLPHTPSTIPRPVINDAANTAANTTLALPGFYCKNKGHQPTYVPFTVVNDGVCDYDICCDGSDEWASVGSVKCPDKCAEIGKEWKKANEARQKALSGATKRRKELIADARKKRKETEDRISSLKTEIEGKEMKVKQLEAELANVEATEKRRVIKAPGTGGKLGVLVGLARQRVDELRDSLTRVRTERDEKATRLEELETIMRAFKEEYNPNFNDEGVKRAVRAWDDYAAKGPGSEGPAAQDRDLDEILKSDSENGLDWDEYTAGDADSDVDVLYQFENYLPPSVRTWVDLKVRDLRVFLEESGVLARQKRAESTDSKALTEARDRHNGAKSELSNSQGELKRHEDDLSKNYGPDEVFRALDGQCISTDSGEYTYELCWLGRTTQKPKKGGSNTHMGEFVRFDTITVDEELPPDGKGLGEGERVAMRYENGQHCWNGPARSTLVVMACAEKDEIWKVVEEEKCVYRMEVGTPAVCVSGSTKKDSAEKPIPANPEKDEL